MKLKLNEIGIHANREKLNLIFISSNLFIKKQQCEFMSEVLNVTSFIVNHLPDERHISQLFHAPAIVVSWDIFVSNLASTPEVSKNRKH